MQQNTPYAFEHVPEMFEGTLGPEDRVWDPGPEILSFVGHQCQWGLQPSTKLEHSSAFASITSRKAMHYNH